MNLNLDTKTPIDQLPAGSVRYEFVGGTMMIYHEPFDGLVSFQSQMT